MGMIRHFPQLFICLLITLGQPTTSVAQNTIDILVPPAVLDDIPVFLDNDSIVSVKNFDRAKSRRDTVDFILLYQALVLGGINEQDIELMNWGDDSYNRLLSRLRSGDQVLFSNTIWREDIAEEDPTLTVSEASLQNGDYIAGLYMAPNNPKFSQPIDLTHLTAISSKQWRPDWQALERLPLKHLYPEVSWGGMLKMAHSQRVDFMLIPFSAHPDFEQRALGITLKPLQNIKIALAGSRGWAISKIHPRSIDVINAVNKGITQLKRQGIIRQAYIAAGVINPRVAHWPLASQLIQSQTLSQP